MDSIDINLVCTVVSKSFILVSKIKIILPAGTRGMGLLVGVGVMLVRAAVVVEVFGATVVVEV